MMRGRLSTVLVAILGAATAHASGDVCSDPKDREFDFWIGEWSIENRQANPGNPTDPNLYATGSAKARVFPVAGGCAIVELWEGELSWGHVLGFSLRSYDATTDKWTLLLNWPAPNAGVPAAFTMRDGIFQHGRGEFLSSSVGADGNSILSRFTFSDITDERYRWDGAVSQDDGVNWQTTWIMEGRRSGGVATKEYWPAMPEGDETGACAEGPDSSSMAYLGGEWAGKTDDGRVVELEVTPVMGGCAVLETLRISGGQAWEEFRVRAYQESNSQWTRFAVNNHTEGLVGYTGASSNGRTEWQLKESQEIIESWKLDDQEVLHWRRTQPDGEFISAVLSHVR